MIAKTYYEVLWYLPDDSYDYKQFHRRDSAIAFYNEHKNDTDKHGWWVTKRDSDGYILEDIII